MRSEQVSHAGGTALGTTSQEAHFSLVARSFDAVAPVYDAAFEREGSIMAALRRRSLATLEHTLPLHGLVLEVGCGTGVEAVALAQAGRCVVATDISEGMLAQARRRTLAAGVADRIAFVLCAAHDLAQLPEVVPLEGLAGAYSSFGALNCEPDLAPVVRALALLLPPDAPLVLSVMNRWCLWELAWYLAHGQPGRALRRVRSGWMAGPHLPPPRSPQAPSAPPPSPKVGRGRGLGESEGQTAPSLAQLPVWYWTPRSLMDAFQPWFCTAQIGGLAVALPPPALDPWLARRPRLARLLAKLEDQVWNRWPFFSWGDHVLIVLRRTETLLDPPARSQGDR